MELVKYNGNAVQIKKIETAIKNCESVEEIKQGIIPQISGILELLKATGMLTIEEENELKAIRLKAEIKLGKLLSKLKKKQGKSNKLNDTVSFSEYTQTIKDCKINIKEAERLQEIKGVTEKEVDELKEKANKEGIKVIKKRCV